VYYAEKLPVHCKDEDELYETAFQLFEILAETEEMSYFRSGFIQRLINYMWDSQLVRYYNVVSILYLTSYFLIVSASIALRWTDEYPYESSATRATLLTINLVVLVMSLCTFEVKSLLADGLKEYLSSFWNKNDMLLFTLSITNLIQEYS
jgi:multisubunit Na+/H+ antiporter MnhG subunit